MVKCDSCKHYTSPNEGILGLFGMLAYIGAAIYFISITNGGFWEVILALLKATVWPAYLIFNVLTALGV